MKSIQWVYILLLLIVSGSASLFIIFESGEFYQQLYPQKAAGLPMGYWAAGLNEIFMAIMAAVWLPRNSRKSSSLGIQGMNLLFKALLVLLFITTIGGASFQITQKTLSDIQIQNNNRKVAELLESQIRDNKESLAIFTSQNQRINSVLSIRRQDSTKEELKSLIKNSKIELLLWVQLVFLILLRFVIQMANLCCVWLIGWIYRHRVISVTVKKPKNKLPEVASQPKIALLKTPLHNQEKQLQTIREEIIRMINTKNNDVSLVDVGNAIKESPETLSKIINPDFKLVSKNIPKLTTILNKLREIYHQEKASGY
jgi:hypothetical protein